MQVRWVKGRSLLPACPGIPVTCTVVPGWAQTHSVTLTLSCLLVPTVESISNNIFFVMDGFSATLACQPVQWAFAASFVTLWLVVSSEKIKKNKKQKTLKRVDRLSAMQRNKGISCQTF